ncbi:MAG TPA: phosphatidate cytidylyltransferase [Terriglobia bacterium]|nr:phosphatidate cytidylyltransferase [Terriglobia bacterium]
MRNRILTALALIPPVAYVLGWAPEWLFVLVLIAVAELCLYEYFAICRHVGLEPMAWVGYVAGALICLASATQAQRLTLALPMLPVVPFLILSLAMLGTPDLKNYLGKVACTLFGLVYIPLALSALTPIRFRSIPGHCGLVPAWELKDPRWAISLLFAVIWGGDTLAYFVGRAIGRHPLAARISPKKTLEGAIGGLLGSVLAGLGARFAFPGDIPNLDLGAFIAVVILVALAGQIGDLAESALKRGAKMKDSGAILPGHGGMLDRLDSLLFAAPTLWLVLTVVSRW